MTTHDVFADLDLSRARLVRHKLEHPRRAFLHPDAFAAYQEGQRADRFGDARYLVSFVNGDGTTARFVGVWHVDGSEPGHAMDEETVERMAAAHHRLGQPLTREHVRTTWMSERITRYRLSRVDRYDDLVGDLVVEWGPGARAWVQRADGQPKWVLTTHVGPRATERAGRTSPRDRPARALELPPSPGGRGPHADRLAESLGLTGDQAGRVLDAVQDLCVRQGGRRPSRSAVASAVGEAVAPTRVPDPAEVRRRLGASSPAVVEVAVKTADSQEEADSLTRLVRSWGETLRRWAGRRPR